MLLRSLLSYQKRILKKNWRKITEQNRKLIDYICKIDTYNRLITNVSHDMVELSVCVCAAASHRRTRCLLDLENCQKMFSNLWLTTDIFVLSVVVSLFFFSLLVDVAAVVISPYTIYIVACRLPPALTGFITCILLSLLTERRTFLLDSVCDNIFSTFRKRVKKMLDERSPQSPQTLYYIAKYTHTYYC